MQVSNYSLVLAGCFSFIAAVAHVGVIIGGPAWYRLFGAGEAMAQMAEAGHYYPALLTSFIALALCVAGLYAFSGAGLIARLPLLQPVLVLITFVFCARGVAGLIIPFVSNDPYIVAQGFAFWIWSSSFCLVIGAAHLWGVKQAWPYLVQ